MCVCVYVCVCRHHLLNAANAISFCFTIITETDMGCTATRAHTHIPKRNNYKHEKWGTRKNWFIGMEVFCLQVILKHLVKNKGKLLS